MRKQEFAELKTAKSCLRAWKGFSGSHADRKNLPGELVRKHDFAELKTANSRLRAWKGFSGSYADRKNPSVEWCVNTSLRNLKQQNLVYAPRRDFLGAMRTEKTFLGIGA